MSIIINKKTRLLVQGITGNEGLFHTQQMLTYGTKVVAGVTPGKGGEWVLGDKVPVFDSCRAAVDATGANVTVIFVPPAVAPDAMFEAADAGIPLHCLHHRGRPGSGYDEGARISGSEKGPPAWSELPGIINSW